MIASNCIMMINSNKYDDNSNFTKNHHRNNDKSRLWKNVIISKNNEITTLVVEKISIVVLIIGTRLDIMKIWQTIMRMMTNHLVGGWATEKHENRFRILPFLEKKIIQEFQQKRSLENFLIANVQMWCHWYVMIFSNGMSWFMTNHE